MLNRCSLMTPASSCRRAVLSSAHSGFYENALYKFTFTYFTFTYFLDRRDVPSSSQSARFADGLLPGTSRCTPSFIIRRRLVAYDCFCRCPLPFLPTGHTLARSHASTTRRLFERRWLMLPNAIDDCRRTSCSNRCLKPIDATGNSRWTWNFVARRQPVAVIDNSFPGTF